MGLNNLGLGFVFTARDLASAKMTRLERRFTSLDDRVTAGTNRMTGAFRQLGVGLAVFTAGAVAVAGALSLANAAGRFEQGLARVGERLGDSLHAAGVDADGRTLDERERADTVPLDLEQLVGSVERLGRRNGEHGSDVLRKQPSIPRRAGVPCHLRYPALRARCFGAAC